MKLSVQPFELELVEDGVNAIRHDQRRAFGALGEEVTHRTIHRARHADGLAVAGEQRKRSINLAHRLGLARQHALPRLVEGQVMDLIERRVKQVNHAFDIVVHDFILLKLYVEFNHAEFKAPR